MFLLEESDNKTQKSRPIRIGLKFLERETRFELATSTLARLHSTTELFPPSKANHCLTV